MTIHEQDHIARLEKQAQHAANERRQLLSVLNQVRAALGTPDGEDIIHHAIRVVAERKALQEDYDTVVALWNGVPWATIYEVVLTQGDSFDAVQDLHYWYIAKHKAFQAVVQEVKA